MNYGRYRTKTYIAADWTGDKDAVDQLYKWKSSNYWSFDFVDAHDLTQARDSSLNCSIKTSLKKRLDVSKTFVLIVGDQTKNVRAGSCQYCTSYSAWTSYCTRGHTIDHSSYIEYECRKAVEAGIKIVVLYNSIKVDKSKCPDVIRNYGKHIPMIRPQHGNYWDYQGVKDAIQN